MFEGFLVCFWLYFIHYLLGALQKALSTICAFLSALFRG